MIHTIRTVAVGDQESKIDSPIILYRGDREVEVEFTINGSKFSFTNGGNVIKSTNATHGQLVINTPTGENMFSEVTECHDGKVVFVITKEMIDELIEVGFYSFQIRLFDGSQVSRVTIPPVLKGIDIRNPIAAEDETNVVDIGLVDYAVVVKDEFEDLSTFLPDGNYNKTEWESKDVISGAKLNKIEDALYNINSNMEATDLALLNRVENINKNVYGKIEKLENELENNVDEFKIDITDNVEKFKNDIDNTLDDVVYFITPEKFGYIDGEDSTKALDDAIKYCKTNNVKLICRDVTLFANIDFRGVNLEITGTLNLGEHTCKLGSSSQRKSAPTQTIQEITQKSNGYQLLILGSKSQSIFIGRAENLKFELSTIDSESSIAYSTFTINYCSSILIDNANGVTEGTLWFNENTFYLKRCVNFHMNGSYNHNNNIIHGGCFEDGASIIIDRGVNNSFRDVRFEGTPSVTFGRYASHNYIFSSWISSARLTQTNVIDNGRDNKIIYTNIEPRFKHFSIDTIDYTDSHFNGTYDVETGLLELKAWEFAFISPITPFNSGITLFSDIVGSNGCRFGYSVYDENFNKLTDVVEPCVTVYGTGQTLPETHVPTSTNVRKQHTVETLVISDERVKYIQFSLRAGSAPITFTSIDVYIRPGYQKIYV